MNEAFAGFGNTTKKQFAALNSRVEELQQRSNPAVLEREVEELSGQLVSLAQRSRQQQDLLEKIWGRVSALPRPQQPCPGLGLPHLDLLPHLFNSY